MTTPSSFDISRAGPGFVDLSAVRDWQRCWSTTRPWQTWNWEANVLVIPVLRLGVWWRWWGCWGTSREGKGTAVGIQTELVEGGMVNWEKGRPYRGLVPRCAKSMMQIWVSLFLSFHWRPHDMWVSEKVWEECGRTRWDFLWISKNLRWFHDVFCWSLFAVRLWQKDWSTTRPWQTWLCITTTLVIPELRLGVWWGWWGCWGIGHEGWG